MKLVQYLASALFFLAGIALLCAPAHGQKPFAPTRFSVTDSGKAGAPDVILIPGLSSSAAVWDGEAKLLAPNYRLHIVQVAGFAGAPAGPNATGVILPGIVEELHQYIVANKLHPVVMGHSLGGLLSLLLADKYPADVRKLVIVDSLPSLAALYNPSATAETAKAIADGMRTQFGSIPDDQYNAMAPMMAAQMVTDPAAQKLVAAASLASDRKVVVEAMAEDVATDLRPEVANIKVPALMLYPANSTAATQLAGGADKVDAIYQGQYKPMPNVTLVRIDGSRHFIMYDQPAKFDASLEPFLK